MSERKVINKYYHPEVFESKIPMRRTPKNNQIKIRNMVAMTIQCSVCGEYIFCGKKLNSRKEVIEGDEYLGMKNCRFYIRCTRCASELTLKTDYEHNRYVCESNCKSIHDNTRSSNLDGVESGARDREEENHGMTKVEQKALSSKDFQSCLDQLEDIKEWKSRRDRLIQQENTNINKRKHKQDEEFNLSTQEERELEDYVQYQAKKVIISDFEDDPQLSVGGTENETKQQSFLSQFAVAVQPKKKRKGGSKQE